MVEFGTRRDGRVYPKDDDSPDLIRDFVRDRWRPEGPPVEGWVLESLARQLFRARKQFRDSPGDPVREEVSPTFKDYDALLEWVLKREGQ